jgi:hypothetical protein
MGWVVDATAADRLDDPIVDVLDLVDEVERVAAPRRACWSLRRRQALDCIAATVSHADPLVMSFDQITVQRVLVDLAESLSLR